MQGGLALPAPLAAPAMAPALQALPLVPAQDPAWHLGCLASAEHSLSFELAMWQAAQPPAPGMSAGVVSPAIFSSIGYQAPAGPAAQPPLGPATAGAQDDMLAQLRVQAALGLLFGAAHGGGQGMGHGVPLGDAPSGALSPGPPCLREAPHGMGVSRHSMESFGVGGGSVGSSASVSGDSELSPAQRTLRSTSGGPSPLGTPSQLGVAAQLLPAQGAGPGQGFVAPGQFAALQAAGMLRQQLLPAQAFGPGQGVPPLAARPQPPPAGYTPEYAPGLPQALPQGGAQGFAALTMHRGGYIALEAASSAGFVPELGMGAGPGLPHMRAPAPQQLWPPRMPFPKP